MYLYFYLCEQNNGGIQENGGWEGTQLNVRSAGTDSISPPLYSSILSTQQTQWHKILSCRYKYKLQSTILIHLVDGTKKRLQKQIETAPTTKSFCEWKNTTLKELVPIQILQNSFYHCYYCSYYNHSYHCSFSQYQSRRSRKYPRCSLLEN